jgi:YfiH family protein
VAAEHRTDALSAPIRSWSTPAGQVRVAVSSRDDGDFNLETTTHHVVQQRCRRLVDLPWTLLAESHGVDALDIVEPGGCFGAAGDIVTTSLTDTVVGVWVGDCAPIAVWNQTGRIGAVHAGWRGIVAGVLDRAVDAVVADGSDAAEGLQAFVGPTIGPCCYEFGATDLIGVAQAVGGSVDQIAAVDSNDRVSLDVVAAVRIALGRLGVAVVVDGRCTGCDEDLFSYRRRRESARHVIGVWRE